LLCNHWKEKKRQSTGQTSDRKIISWILFIERSFSIRICHVKNYRLGIGKLRRQGCDSAAVLAGVHYDILTKIKAHCPPTKYIYYNSHTFYLVLNDIMTASIDIQNFFAIFQKCYVYFALRGKRWKIFISIEN
jgi:hypothetical protein